MTLDEAIAHAREVAENVRYNAYTFTEQDLLKEECRQAKAECLECVAEHEQLASWLEELKRYKAQKIMIKVDYDKAHTLKEILRHSQFGIAYPDGQYEVVPLVTGGPSDEEQKTRQEAEAKGWIPTKEEEPKESDYYLVTINFFGTPDTRISYFDNGWSLDCVTAWRPLPEPYKESEDKT